MELSSRRFGKDDTSQKVCDQSFWRIAMSETENEIRNTISAPVSDEDLEPLVLTDRDMSLFRYAHEHRYLAYSQIRESFWKERSLDAKACYKRVERLVNAGYLKRGYSGRQMLDVYFATPMSYALLKERKMDSGVELYEVTESFDRHIDHDLHVTNLRILFRDLGFNHWESERILRRRNHRMGPRPDGVIHLGGDKRIAIEFENRNLSKSRKRYQGMMNYYWTHKLYPLLFIVIKGNIKDWLVGALDYDIKQVWMTTYKELMNEREEAVFENKAASFQLKKIL